MVKSHSSVGIVCYHKTLDSLLVVRQFRPAVCRHFHHHLLHSNIPKLYCFTVSNAPRFPSVEHFEVRYIFMACITPWRLCLGNSRCATPGSALVSGFLRIEHIYLRHFMFNFAFLFPFLPRCARTRLEGLLRGEVELQVRLFHVNPNVCKSPFLAVQTTGDELYAFSLCEE